MPLPETLTTLLTPVITAMGYELWGIEFLSRGSHGLLRIYIDSESGITLDDCEKVSRQVSATLDVNDPIAGAYTLEVSSPGTERPLMALAHFQRYVGHPAKLKLRELLDGRRRLKGIIQAVENNTIILHAFEEDLDIPVPFHLIERARLIQADVIGKTNEARS